MSKRFARPKPLWPTNFYSNKDIKVIHWRKVKMYLVHSFIYAHTVAVRTYRFWQNILNTISFLLNTILITWLFLLVNLFLFSFKLNYWKCLFWNQIKFSFVSPHDHIVLNLKGDWTIFIFTAFLLNFIYLSSVCLELYLSEQRLFWTIFIWLTFVLNYFYLNSVCF